MLFLGDILTAKGVVSAVDVERALAYQKENGGRFGDCLVKLGLTTHEDIENILGDTPKSPWTLEDMDVDPMLLLQLMVKGMYVENFELPSQIADAMKLADSIVNALLDRAVERKLAEIVGQKESLFGGYGEKRYTLTRAGRDWAVESLDRNQYFGPAPVSLSAYVERVQQQHITNEWVTRQDIKGAFSRLVIPERFLDRLGPSINSGTAILIYGPAGNGKTTIAEIIGHIFRNVVYIPYCFVVDGQIVKVFDPSIHQPISTEGVDRAITSIQRDDSDLRWVACHRPMVITGGELTLEMLDLKFSTISGFYEAPLQIKALNGIFLIDDFGRQRVDPADILNRWIMPLNNRVDYLNLHTGKSFQVPFDELVIFSTNMHPDELMDPAFLRRITYKLETIPPSEDLFRRVFENVAREANLELTEEIYHQVLDEIAANDAPLAYFQPQFIVGQVLASCKFQGVKSHFSPENVEDALLNLFVKSAYKSAPERNEPPQISAPRSMAVP